MEATLQYNNAVPIADAIKLPVKKGWKLCARLMGFFRKPQTRDIAVFSKKMTVSSGKDDVYGYDNISFPEIDGKFKEFTKNLGMVVVIDNPEIQKMMDAIGNQPESIKANRDGKARIIASRPSGGTSLVGSFFNKLTR